MIDRTTIRASAVAVLKAAGTDAGAAVFSPKDWPSVPPYPSIFVRTPHERKENSAARMGVPQFFSNIKLVCTGRVSKTTEDTALAALESLSVQIENALLLNAQFIVANAIQQIVSVETAMDIKSEAETHLGEAVVIFELEVPQVYQPAIDAAGAPAVQPLKEIQNTVTNKGQPLGPGLSFDVKPVQ